MIIYTSVLDYVTFKVKKGEEYVSSCRLLGRGVACDEMKVGNGGVRDEYMFE